jgi:hypothetical protein
VTKPPPYRPQQKSVVHMAPAPSSLPVSGSGPAVYRPHLMQSGARLAPPVRAAVAQRSHLDTGLKKDAATTRFASKAHARVTGGRNPMGSTKQWLTLTAAERRAKLLKYVNAEFEKTHVPPLKGTNVQAGLGAGNAEFDFATWTITLGSDPPDDAATLSGYLDNVYHESRHAEQWFRIARKLAGEGNDAAAIRLGLHNDIPLDIAQAAEARPLAAQSGASKFFHSKNYNARQTAKLQEATDWYESIYGGGRAHRINVLTTAPMDYGLYRALPEEVDAWIVGPKAAAAFDSQ